MAAKRNQSLRAFAMSSWVFPDDSHGFGESRCQLTVALLRLTKHQSRSCFKSKRKQRKLRRHQLRTFFFETVPDQNQNGSIAKSSSTVGPNTSKAKVFFHGKSMQKLNLRNEKNHQNSPNGDWFLMCVKCVSHCFPGFDQTT